MTVLSVLRGPALRLSNVNCGGTAVTQIFRNLKTSASKSGGGHGHETMQIIPSRFQWQKYKDDFHFYLFLGVIPLCALVFYANVFIGPATLTEIPEGYVPKQWEYHRSPVTRFFSKYLIANQQERYERNIYYMKAMEEKRRMRLLQWRVEDLMRERGDYPNYYTSKTIAGKYVRSAQLDRIEMDTTAGEF